MAGQSNEKELAEVACRSVQYAVRLSDGRIETVAIGPAEARRYREAGIDLMERDRIDYAPALGEWRPSIPPG